jgi:hypothetical protein
VANVAGDWCGFPYPPNPTVGLNITVTQNGIHLLVYYADSPSGRPEPGTFISAKTFQFDDAPVTATLNGNTLNSSVNGGYWTRGKCK